MDNQGGAAGETGSAQAEVENKPFYLAAWHGAGTDDEHQNQDSTAAASDNSRIPEETKNEDDKVEDPPNQTKIQQPTKPLLPAPVWPDHYLPPMSPSWPLYYQAIAEKYVNNKDCAEVFFNRIVQPEFDEAQMVEALTSNDDLVLLVVTPPDNQVALLHQFKFDKKTATQPNGTNKLWCLFGMDQNAPAVNIQLRELARKPDSPALSPDPSKFWECKNKDDFLALSVSTLPQHQWYQKHCCVLPPMMAANLANMSVTDPSLVALEVMKAAKTCDAFLYSSVAENNGDSSLGANTLTPHADCCSGLLQLLWHAAKETPGLNYAVNTYPLSGRAAVWANAMHSLCIGYSDEYSLNSVESTTVVRDKRSGSEENYLMSADKKRLKNAFGSHTRTAPEENNQVSHNFVQPFSGSYAAKKVFPKKTSKTTMNARETILGIMADSHSLGQPIVSRELFSRGTGLAEKTVSNNLSMLRADDLVESLGDKRYRLTGKGVEHMGHKAKVPLSKAERWERLTRDLRGKQLNLLNLLKDGQLHKRLDIAKELGFESHKQKGFQNLIGTLSTLKMVEYPDRDSVKLRSTFVCT